MILAVANIKGGVGKTTLSVNITVARALSGSRVLLVDADEQGSSMDFTQNRRDRVGSAGYEAVALVGREAIAKVASLSEDFDDVVIDVGGHENAGLSAALELADMVLIPMQPSTFDVWSFDRMAATLATARGANPALRALAVINAADTRGRDNDEAAALVNEMEGVEIATVRVSRRKAFRNAASQGCSVLDMSPKDPKAIEELRALVRTLWVEARPSV